MSLSKIKKRKSPQCISAMCIQALINWFKSPHYAERPSISNLSPFCVIYLPDKKNKSINIMHLLSSQNLGWILSWLEPLSSNTANRPTESANWGMEIQERRTEYNKRCILLSNDGRTYDLLTLNCHFKSQNSLWFQNDIFYFWYAASNNFRMSAGWFNILDKVHLLSLKCFRRQASSLNSAKWKVLKAKEWNFDLIFTFIQVQ